MIINHARMDELKEKCYRNLPITAYHKYKLTNALFNILKDTGIKNNIIHATIYLLDKYVITQRKMDSVEYMMIGHACLSLSNDLLFSNWDIDLNIIASVRYHTNKDFTEKMLADYIDKVVIKFNMEVIYTNPYMLLQKFFATNKTGKKKEALMLKYVVTCMLYDTATSIYGAVTTFESICYYVIVWMLECNVKNQKYLDCYLEEDGMPESITMCVKHVAAFICKLNMLSFVVKVNKMPKFKKVLQWIRFLPIVECGNKKVKIATKKKKKDRCGDYNDGELISTGTYGSVFVAKYKDFNKPVALKKQKWEMNGIVEVSVLKYLCHENIIQLIDVDIVVGRKICMIMPYYRRNLHEVVGRSGIKEKIAIKYSTQLLKAVEYCHDMGIIHQDIKPENIMVTDDYDQIVLIDFGISNIYSYANVRYLSPICTLYYRPPEILLECPTYDNKVDIWSVGCVIAEMLLGSPLFHAECQTVESQCEAIFYKTGLPNEDDWPGLIHAKLWQRYESATNFPTRRFLNVCVCDGNLNKIMNGALTFNPANRLSATQSLTVLNKATKLEITN